MNNWIKAETFNELDVVDNQFFYLPESLDKNLVNKRLTASLHMDLYDFF